MTLNNNTCVDTLFGHTHHVLAIEAYDNGHRLASGALNGIIKLWSLASRECERNLIGHSGAVNALTLARRFADFMIKLWDLSSWRCEKTLTGHSFDVLSLKLIEHNTLAPGSEDITIRVWNTHTGMCIDTLSGHTGPVNALEVVYGSLYACGHGNGNGQTMNA